MLTKEEYVNIVCSQLEVLREDIVINRLTGDPNPDDLIEPFRAIADKFVFEELNKLVNIDNIELSSVHVIVPQEKEICKIGVEKIFEDIIAKTFQYLQKKCVYICKNLSKTQAK